MECGFFNSKGDDRLYNAEHFTSYLSSLICNGIQDNYGRCFALSASGGMMLTIGSGKAWINGHYAQTSTETNLDLSKYVDESLSRYVVVGVYCDTAENVRDCDFIVKSGTCSASPAIPAFANTDTRTYLTLCAVLLRAGVTEITKSNITDYRNNDSRCGYVRCILGKCKVSEILDSLGNYRKTVSDLTQQVENLTARLDEVEEISGTNGVTLLDAGKIGESVSYASYSNGNTQIVGSGATYDYDAAENKSPFYNSRDVGSITVKSGVTRIGSYGFYACNAAMATLPDTLKSIGRCAFCGSTGGTTLPPDVGGLRSVTIPASVTALESYAFAQCRLETITLPKTVTSIGKYVLYGCKLLTSAEVLSPTLGDLLFTYCSGLRSLTIGRSVVAFGSTMFTYCDSLTTITYSGTKAQWNAIRKPDDWISANTSSGHHNGTLERISCTDGAFVWNGQTKQWEEET